LSEVDCGDEDYRIMPVESDSDDDLPIIELIKKRKRLEYLKSGKLEAIKSEKADKQDHVKSERVSADRTSRDKGNSSSSSNAKSSSSYINVAAEFYDTTKKGKIIYRFILTQFT